MTLTWGSNTGIELSYGEMVSYESTTSGVGGGEGYENPESHMPSSWFAMGENVENLPFYDMVYSVANQLDFPDTTEGIQTLYFIVIIGIALTVMMVITWKVRSALLGFAGMEIVLFTGSSMYIMPMWIPFSILLVGVGIMYLYKQVAY
jgi:hypothetical protein